ncbi:hypothetical protein SAMN05421820_104331 [Pedobacter steynii]|uniref:Gliding motility-associated protein GldM n=1 Tax=Pedobacter steynii TaxID=430522 RepID=A0A1G9UYU5_9SPHI|nr:hypothetical protein [Pedobacter steynii]NQX40926.1 hypothetical protein [Pedobacter steynii]SDM65144.1 hypothetical protein SAMN05421820_104331 [Pedobacter steynii]
MKKMMCFLAILIGISQFSYSQVSGAFALMALDEIDSKVSVQMQSIDNLVTNGIGNGGNMLLSITNKLRKDINETIGNTDKMLRENQLLVFNQVTNLANEFNTAISEHIEGLDLISVRISQTAQDLIFRRTEPNIFQFNTGKFIKDYSKDYTIKITGNNFSRSDKVYISINNKKIEPVERNFQEMIFKIDSADIKDSGENNFYTRASIIFEWRKGLFNKKMITNEPFIIPIIPLNIGVATFFYEQEFPERQYQAPIEYTCESHVGGSGLGGGVRRNSTAFNLLPTNGRFIDPTSISGIRLHRRYGGGYVFNIITEQQIAGRLTSESQDRRFGGGGSATLKFSYKEFEIVYKAKKSVSENNLVTSVNPFVLVMPDPVDNKRPNLNYVSILTFDNRELKVVPNQSNKYFSLSINPSTDDVVLSWKKGS